MNYDWRLWSKYRMNQSLKITTSTCTLSLASIDSEDFDYDISNK